MNKRAMQGFSLIEIMIAMVISLILMAGVLTIMSTSKRTYAIQGEFAYLQDGARFIMEDMTFGARMAGYFGCSGSLPEGVSMPAPIGGIDNKAIVDATSNTSNTKLQDYPKSDVITLSYFGGGQNRLELNTGAAVSSGGTTEEGGTTGEATGDEEGSGDTETSSMSTAITSAQIKAEKAFIAKTFAPTLNVIPITSSSPLPNPGADRLVFSDCSGSHFFNIGSVSSGQITINGQFERQFGWPLDIFIVPMGSNNFSSITYEVKAIDKSSPPNGSSTGAEDGFALFKDNQLFVEGVQNLQVRYGKMSGAGNAINYTSNPNAFGETVSLRVTLLMRTPNKRYDINDTEDKNFILDPDLLVFNPADAKYESNEIGFRHRLFSSTINVRN